MAQVNQLNMAYIPQPLALTSLLVHGWILMVLTMMEMEPRTMKNTE